MRALLAFILVGSLLGVVAFLTWGDRHLKFGAASPVEVVKAEDVSRHDEPVGDSRIGAETGPVVRKPEQATTDQVTSKDVHAGAAAGSEPLSEFEARFRTEKSAAHSSKSRAALEEIAAGRFEFATSSDAASMEPRLNRPPEEADSTFVRVATEGRTYLVRLRRQDYPDVFELIDKVRVLEQELVTRLPTRRKVVEAEVEDGSR